MNNEAKIAQVEVGIEAAKEAIAVGEALDRLIRNADFIKVIHEGYFKEEASRLVLFKSAPACEEEAAQKGITKAIDAIGGLHQYLTSVFQKSVQMKKALADDELTREELLAEDMA